MVSCSGRLARSSSGDAYGWSSGRFWRNLHAETVMPTIRAIGGRIGSLIDHKRLGMSIWPLLRVSIWPLLVEHRGQGRDQLTPRLVAGSRRSLIRSEPDRA